MADDRRREIRIIVMPTAIIAALMLILLIFWWAINRPVHVTIPPQKTVKPNAYDFYKPRSSDPRVERWVVDWASRRDAWLRSPPSPPLGAPTARGLPAPGMQSGPCKPPPPPRILPPVPRVAYFDDYECASLAERQAVLRGSEARLKRARAGFSYRCVVPRKFLDEQIAERFRVLGGMLVVDGQIRELHGDWDGALGSYVDSVRVSSDAAESEVLRSAMLRLAANYNAWLCIDRVSGKSARAASRRLDAILNAQPSFADVLLEHKYRVQKWLAGFLGEERWRQRLLGYYDDWGVKDSLWKPKLRCHVASRAAIMGTSNRWLDLRIREARKPFPLDRTPDRRSMYNLSSFPDSVDSLQSFSVPRGTSDRRFWEYARAMDELLATALALRAWKIEHGSYPGSLKQLVPRYLSKMPADPFAIRASLHYRRKGTGYLLYSIGPDFEDNRGEPMREDADLDKRGLDIVAGVTEVAPPLPHSLIAKRPVRRIPSSIVRWEPVSNLLDRSVPQGPPAPGM